jgi:general secretion pathway protein D
MRHIFPAKARQLKHVMKQSRSCAVAFFILFLAVYCYADQASAAYKRGVHAENQNQYDQAYENYRQAYTLKPKDPKYMGAYTRLRFYVGVEHVRKGQELLVAGKLPEAEAEFQLAAQVDDTNFVAKEEARRVEEMIRKAAHKESKPAVPEPLSKQAEEAGGPVELQPITDTRINLRLTENVNFIYKTIGKLAGINVLFDSDFKSQKVTIELNDVTLREALDAVAVQSKTFWQATSPNTILVAADTPAKRKELQNTVMKAFYLKNLATPAELQEAANTLKGILDISRIQLIPNQNALILRGTPDQMVLSQLLLQDIDKPKSEVVVDVAVMQVSRNKMLTLGAVPPTSASIALNGAATTGTNGAGNTTTVNGSNGGSLTINTFRYLNANNFVVTVGSYSFTALASDADTKVIQKPQIWTLDNEKASLKIGDRIPIATGSFGATGGTQGYGALVNTQFQYIDVGVNIDITPHIHSDKEVTLKMTLEISSVTGTTNIGGINQPTIGQRRIDLQSRLQDGDINLVGGILEDTETQSLSGYPGIQKVPVLKYLFAQDSKQRQENEIVFAIMPHIVRAQQLTEDNLRLVDVGAGSSVTVRHDPKKAGSGSADPDSKTDSQPQSSQEHGNPAQPSSKTVIKPSGPPANAPANTPTSNPPVPGSPVGQKGAPATPGAEPAARSSPSVPPT